MASTKLPTAPTYHRSELTPGILHFGVGNFHRSHQAMYLDRLLRRRLARDWGIVGVGLLPRDKRMGEILHSQDFTYTLAELASDGTTTGTQIGSIIDYLHAPSDPAGVHESLASPSIRIASLTITEGGYNTSDVTGEFDITNPEIIADATAETPRTIFGVLAAGVKLRRDRGVAPLTVLSCDNILGNGDVTRAALVAFARIAYNDEFADWIDTETSFPNSMVDRITPVTTDSERTLVRDRFGIDDGWPVVCEPFVQWVLEDRFPTGRPAWDEVGVQLVDDVAPYELLKLRLLNGSHQTMAYAGLLRGHTYVHEAMQDPTVVRLVEQYLDEAASTLQPVEGIDIPTYRGQLMDRFANPHIRDTLARLATDASDRIPKFIVPVARERLQRGLSSPAVAAVAAGWAAQAHHELQNGELNDRKREQVADALTDTATIPASFLAQRDWFGELAGDGAFAADFTRAFDVYTAGAPTS